MPDRLRSLIGKHDRDNARAHRLTGEPVVPPRGDSNKKRVCGSCWHVVDEQAERKAWQAKVGCHFGERYGGGVCFMCYGECCTHRWPGVLVCPKCGADALGWVGG